jgi:hypothetical protein
MKRGANRLPFLLSEKQMMRKLVQKIFLALVLMLVMSLFGIPAYATEIVVLSVDAPNHQGNHMAGNMIDGDSATAWVGGGMGIGPGKWIKLVFSSPVVLQSMRVLNGNQHTGQFDKFRRITRGVILYPDESRQEFTLKSARGEQSIRLKSVTADSIKIIITRVAPSSKDKVMGKAKVAVSEIKVYGTVVKTGETSESNSGKNQPVVKPKSVAKPKSAAKSKSVPVAKKVDVSSKAEAKAVVKPKPKPKPKKKASGKKSRPVSLAMRPGSTRLRASVPVPPDKPMTVGVISPWLDLEFVAQIKRYFALLTTLHDSYPDVFSSDIRERERTAFLDLQEQMRTKKWFGKHHIAMVEHIGLGFDKPVLRDDSAMVHVHGPYRYYLEDKAFEYPVDTMFSFRKEGGQWMINGVRDK